MDYPHSSCHLKCWEFPNRTRTCTLSVMDPRDSYQSAGGCGDGGKDAAAVVVVVFPNRTVSDKASANGDTIRGTE